MNHTQTQLNRQDDTGKFWSFKNTMHYKNAKLKHIKNSDAYRMFRLTKSFLLKVDFKDENSWSYVIPLCFKSYGSFPDGSYEGIDDKGKKVYFTEKQIQEVYK